MKKSSKLLFLHYLICSFVLFILGVCIIAKHSFGGFFLTISFMFAIFTGWYFRQFIYEKEKDNVKNYRQF